MWNALLKRAINSFLKYETVILFVIFILTITVSRFFRIANKKKRIARHNLFMCCYRPQCENWISAIFIRKLAKKSPCHTFLPGLFFFFIIIRSTLICAQVLHWRGNLIKSNEMRYNSQFLIVYSFAKKAFNNRMRWLDWNVKQKFALLFMKWFILSSAVFCCCLLFSITLSMCMHCCHQTIKNWFQTFFHCIVCMVRMPFYHKCMPKFFLLLFWFYNVWNLFIASILFENYSLNIYWRYHSVLRIKYELIFRWKHAYIEHIV